MQFVVVPEYKVKIILSIICLFVAQFALAQKPRYVPFQYQGEIGIMDTAGNTFIQPGVFGDFDVVDDFKAYIVSDQLLTNKDFFFNAVSGQGAVDIEGTLDRSCGPLAVGKRIYYHFWVEGVSVMTGYGNEAVYLPQRYLKIEPNKEGWDNENLPDKHFVWALKRDYTYDVLLPEQQFATVKNLADFTSYDLIFATSETGTIKLIGFVLGSRQAIDREFGQMYGIRQSDSLVTVYDVDFKKLGRAAYRETAVSSLFKENVQFRGSLVPPPQMRNQIIYPEGKPVRLNDEFSFIPDAVDSYRLILVNSKRNNERVLGAGNFDYRYFSVMENAKALLQIRHEESGSIFFFDFNGTFFPRGIPMIPKDKMEWTSNQ